MLSRPLVILVLTVGAVTASVLACPPPEDSTEALAAAAARRDVAAGTPKLWSWGIKAREWAMTEAFRRQLGLQFAAKGCVVTEEEIRYIETYNRTVIELLEAEHGERLLEAAAEEVRLLAILAGVESRKHKDLRHAGAVAAKDDARAGRFLKVRGETATEIERVYEELLRRELGVHTVPIHERPEGLWAFLDGYNDRMRQELRTEAGLERWRELREKAPALAAERDIAAGRLVIKQFGMPGPATLIEQRLLKERFGVEMQLGGCIMPADYDPTPYNEAMRAEIERRFGKGILEATAEEARRIAAQGPDLQG